VAKEPAADKELLETSALAARLRELEGQVAYLSDHHEIIAMYRRYMRGFDRNDVDLLKSSFWADAQINYGSQSNSVDDFIARHLKPQVTAWAYYGHLLTNESIEIADNTAHVETYVMEFASRKDGTSVIAGGRYVDRVDRRDAEWRIAVREFVPQFWTETDNALDSHFPASTWLLEASELGRSDKSDVSYRRPLASRDD